MTWPDVCDAFCVDVKARLRGADSSRHGEETRAKFLRHSAILCARPVAEHDDALALAWVRAILAEPLGYAGHEDEPRDALTVRNIARVLDTIYKFAQANGHFPRERRRPTEAEGSRPGIAGALEGRRPSSDLRGPCRVPNQHGSRVGSLRGGRRAAARDDADGVLHGCPSRRDPRLACSRIRAGVWRRFLDNSGAMDATSQRLPVEACAVEDRLVRAQGAGPRFARASSRWSGLAGGWGRHIRQSPTPQVSVSYCRRRAVPRGEQRRLPCRHSPRRLRDDAQGTRTRLYSLPHSYRDCRESERC